MSTPRILTAVFLALGVFFVMTSAIDPSMLGFLSSGQGSTIPLQGLDQGVFHAAAAAPVAGRQLILGILLILLAFGIYTLSSLRHRDRHSLKQRKPSTFIRTYSRWFWIP